MRSILVQVAILSVDLPQAIQEAIRQAHREMSAEAGVSDLNLAVRSSAAGEDSRRKAFAGLQDTYLNIRSEDMTIQAYQWDCASAYNFRCLIYRRESILDAIHDAERLGDESIAQRARKDWDIQNTSLSVCLMRMVDPVIAGTAFSADTATGFRGGIKNDLVSIDASWGIGEAIVGGIVTPDKYIVYQRDNGREVILRTMGYKNKQYVYDPEANGTVLEDVPEDMVFNWTLSIAQSEQIAKGVRLISKAYNGMIMDTEFVIDSHDRLWFVQARPETKWNTINESSPNTISMRRWEVEPDELKFARVIL
jgi:pyruvate,water dikinase